MLLRITSAILLLLCLAHKAAGNCKVSGCAAGLCCSQYGYCGIGPDYCTGAVGGNCQVYGCPSGQCCSQWGYCGVTAEHCGGAGVGQVGGSLCGVSGCPAGSCCSSFGYCGTSAAHCGGAVNGGAIGGGPGGCRNTGCGTGLCCTIHGYCDVISASCYYGKSLSEKKAASIEGEFQGQAMFYDERKVGTNYSTCGISRTLSLDENNQKIYTAALNRAQFDPYTIKRIPSTNPICGKKAIVKGEKGEITVRFVDRCNDCELNNIALTRDAFIAVAGELGTDLTKVKWQFI